MGLGATTGATHGVEQVTRHLPLTRLHSPAPASISLRHVAQKPLNLFFMFSLPFRCPYVPLQYCAVKYYSITNCYSSKEGATVPPPLGNILVLRSSVAVDVEGCPNPRQAINQGRN